MKGIKAYQQNSLDSVINVASPYEITRMLFGAAAKNINIAIAAHKRNDYILKSESISKAQSIVMLLATTLDDEKAEGVSDNLRLLYDYIIRTLTDYMVEPDEEKARSALSCIMQIKSAWDEIKPDESTGLNDGQ